jgi:uncharacterized protein Yka (UPF0111/DUF47 family)
MINKLKGWILPKEINFFKSLNEHSLQTLNVVENVAAFYTATDDHNSGHILDLISELKKNHANNLKELNSTFITPVDRESISRAYSHLYWVALSIKHLVMETEIYKINNLTEYKEIFDLLQQEMSHLTDGFNKLDTKNYFSALEIVDLIIHLDNVLIRNYATQLAILFNEKNIQHILIHKDILSQLKEISKRIHICANLLEDIVFKMN